MKHGDRLHATWSASATERNVACPGALALGLKLAAPDKESLAAAWGTACHQVAEHCLKDGKAASDFIGMAVKTKEHEFAFDEEQAETTQTYVDYVFKQAATHPKNQLFVERKFSLEAISPPFDAGGTADAVVYHAADRLLEVVDLKGGRGEVVEVIGNPQARTYAVGALLAFPGLRVERVKSTIVQPRAFHKDGPTRSETISAGALMDWTVDLLAAMEASAEAIRLLKEADGGPGPAHDAARWAVGYLNPGDHCTFCPAAGSCPALANKSLTIARASFTNYGKVATPPAATSLSPDQVAAVLDGADMLEGWVNAVRAYGHSLAESGVKVGDYILVDKIGRRAWADEEAACAFLMSRARLDHDDVMAPPKLKSPAQAEKLLPKDPELKKEFDKLCPAPSRGTNLVLATKTTRPAVKPIAQQIFSKVEQ